MLNSIVNYSNIINSSRLDAEYFQRKFLKLQKKFEKEKYSKLNELCEFICAGPAGSALLSSRYTAAGIKVYRPSNLNGWNCDNSGFVYISKKYCKEHRLPLYKKGDLLITRIGDIKFGAIEGDSDPATISPNLIVLRTKKDLLDPFFLLAFLNTKFGITQIQRGKKVVSLASVGIGHIANILIPPISLEEQLKIGERVKMGLKNIRLAKLLYSDAEKNLMRAINSNKIEESERFASINLKELKEKQRADAQYFLQLKKSNPSKIKTVQIEKIAKIFRGIDPGRKTYQKNGKIFLRVSNISKYGILDKSQKYINQKLFKNLCKKYQPSIGEILLVKDGKPGVSCVVVKPIEGITSEGIVRLKLKKNLTPEYVSLCINSPFCQSHIHANIDGTLMPHLKIEQIKKLKIPLASSGQRKNLTNAIKKSVNLFQKGNNNLIQAMRQTEKGINNI